MFYIVKIWEHIPGEYLRFRVADSEWEIPKEFFPTESRTREFTVKKTDSGSFKLTVDLPEIMAYDCLAQGREEVRHFLVRNVRIRSSTQASDPLRLEQFNAYRDILETLRE